MAQAQTRAEAAQAKAGAENAIQPRSGASLDAKEKVELGIPEVWVKRTPQGVVRAVQSIITLREAQKEIAFIEGAPMITADGYYRMNQVASLAIITPDSIRIPDAQLGHREVPNPYPIIDPESGTQKGVWVKKIAVGYSPIGSLVVSSTTLFYDFRLYFIADLQKKIRNDAKAGRHCFEEQLTEEERKKGIFLRIDGTFGIWANMEHPEVLKAVTTMIQNKQFGERKAQSVAERNAFKHHPALSQKLAAIEGPQGHRTGKVAVIGWVHDHTREELEEIALSADSGHEIEVKGKKVEVVQTEGQVTEEDVAASEESDLEPGEAENGGHGEDPLFGTGDGRRPLF